MSDNLEVNSHNMIQTNNVGQQLTASQPSVSTFSDNCTNQQENSGMIQFIEMENVLSKMDNQIVLNTSSPQSPTQLQPTNAPPQSSNIPHHQNMSKPVSNQVSTPTPKKKKDYVITTKCGQIQLTFERVLSFFVMILTITILLIISILSTGTIFIRSATEDNCYHRVSSILVNLNKMKTNYDIMFSSPSTRTKLLIEVNSSMVTLKSEVYMLLDDIPYYSRINNITRDTVIPELKRNFNLLEIDQSSLFRTVTNNNMDISTYRNYLTNMQIFITSLENPLLISDRAAFNEDLYMNYSAVINLILVSITLLIIIPVMVIVLIITIGRDNLFMDKLKKADAHVVIETMENQHSQSQFREYCKQHGQYSQYLFLEKVQLYTEYCEQIYHLHDDIDITSDASGESIKHLQYEIDIAEGKKFELAFEIITEFLDIDSESFLGLNVLGGKKSVERVKKTFDTKSLNLPDNLFKTFQTNVAVELLQIFKQFKQHQKRTREQRKQKINLQLKPMSQ